MKRLTVAVALALSVSALPAMADCPGKKKHDQTVMTLPGGAAEAPLTTTA